MGQLPQMLYVINLECIDYFFRYQKSCYELHIVWLISWAALGLGHKEKCGLRARPWWQANHCSHLLHNRAREGSCGRLISYSLYVERKKGEGEDEGWRRRGWHQQNTITSSCLHPETHTIGWIQELVGQTRKEKAKLRHCLLLLAQNSLSQM